MDKVYIEDIAGYEDKEVQLRGWVYNKRSSGKIQFVLLRDGTGIIQCVILKDEVADRMFQECSELTQESSLVIQGKVRKDDRAVGGYELTVTDIRIIHVAEEYPITPKEHGTGFLMDHRHLWIRSKRQHAILRIRAGIIKACQDFFDDRGFIRVDSPILTGNACEGTSTLFSTPYFDETAYLTQTGQLYAEAAAMSFANVYCFGPTFRAEKSKTRRHLTEFWMIEPEMAFADLDDAMKVAEEMLIYIVDQILKKHGKELITLERDIAPLEKITAPFPRITYDQALQILHDNSIEFQWGNDLGAEEETILANSFEKPLLIHRYPAKSKAFYMEPDPENPELSLCVDILAPEGYGEIIGGSQRIHDLEILKQKLDEYRLPADAFQWYLDLRKYGTVPHSGFGMGIERVVAWICGIQHIREAIPFPRTIYRLYP